ncbi:DUF2614 family zinc ribbon-containing protein [Chengkuizengella marina]|uniref:Zinc-ribbon containing domain-containing protein n=1 Tax=Chengkuizengella marina TaxID=2507566 RepID=A0A6N9Q547_9BACL|nr:DUF2614 family zinc ribbon-containing protein [Chengkuizengella marina]NBI29975.1 hypothetical protein [Chengkuizengella marina]
MFLKSSKINELRLWGLLLTLGGMGIMIIGTGGLLLWGNLGKYVISIPFMIIGTISLLGSVAVYFWAGTLSTSSITLECPECRKPTRHIGKTDRCMHCRTILTFDENKANGSITKDQKQ